jgi:hypothetical protein
MNKTLYLFVLWTCCFATASAFMAPKWGPHGDDAEYVGVCDRPGGEKGSLFRNARDGKVVEFCCPKGQMPTGNYTDNRIPFCKVPGPSRGDCSNRKLYPEEFFCEHPTSPFRVCCPAAQYATCRENDTEPQCEAFPEIFNYPEFINYCPKTEEYPDAL